MKNVKEVKEEVELFILNLEATVKESKGNKLLRSCCCTCNYHRVSSGNFTIGRACYVIVDLTYEAGIDFPSGGVRDVHPLGYCKLHEESFEFTIKEEQI